jgi:ADP-ribosylglycohydrolase
MRAPLIGVAVGHDHALLRALVRASTRITHTDPKAEYGALAVALAAHLAAMTRGTVTPAQYREALVNLLKGDCADELVALVERAVASVQANESTPAFAEQLGLARGVSGYMYHTVPVALHAWLSHQRDVRDAVVAVIQCGGDCDSSAAIVGAMVGAGVGIDGIPGQWRARLIDWPRTVAWMQALAERLDAALVRGESIEAPRLSATAILLRNLFFLAVVLTHGLRRLLPPY